MSRTITIEPVTRVEGHGKVTLYLNDAGEVEDARFNVVEFRGFEKFCEGRHFSEMPTLTQRICGICPVSHHLAAAKAIDAICGVKPPPTARMLRELMHMGQMVQSHALSFFHLSAPDLLLGFDATPEKRNVFGLIADTPEVARRGIRLRKFGQEVIAAVGGRRIHPDVCVPGGMNRPLLAADRDRLLGLIDEAKQSTRVGLDLLKTYFDREYQWVEDFAKLTTYYMGLVTADGDLELYDGFLRMKNPDGKIVEDMVDTATYLSLIAESTEPWSYLKFPFYRRVGYPSGSYRVGPMARLNICRHTGTPEADRELSELRDRHGDRPIEGSMYYHYARLIETIYGLERIDQLLQHRDILGHELINESRQTAGEGVGVIEAPRGTLFHHYTVNDDGSIVRANLIVASGNNNYAMNQGVLQVAKQYVDGNKLQEPMLNRVEAAIRCYDPCLSCSTHAMGQMPLEILLVDATGQVLDRLVRNAP